MDFDPEKIENRKTLFLPSPHKLNPNLSFSWTIKLHKVDPLPGTELKLAILYDKHLREPDKRSFDMGIGVPLGMVKPRLLRNKFFEKSIHICFDIGIGVLIYRDRRGRVRTINQKQSILPVIISNNLLHLNGDIDYLVTGGGRE